MAPEHTPEVASEDKKPTASENLHTVTPVSKYLAMLLFILLPFIGGWIGYNYAPVKVIAEERVVEVEKIVEVEIVANNEIDENLDTSNVFKSSSVKVGDKYGEMSLEEFVLFERPYEPPAEIEGGYKDNNEYIRATFTGLVTLAGELWMPTGNPEEDGRMGPDYSIENLSTSSVSKLPHSSDHSYPPDSFGIINTEILNGKGFQKGDLVKVVVGEYRYVFWPAGGWSTAEIISIKKIDSE